MRFQPSNLLKAAETQTGSRCLTLRARTLLTLFFFVLFFFLHANRTYGELDVLFGAKVPARKFATTSIDQFQAIEHEVASADVEKSSVSDKGGVEAGDGITVAQLPKSQ